MKSSTFESESLRSRTDRLAMSNLILDDEDAASLCIVVSYHD